MVRAVAASLALLAGCYSPSFVPCELACSNEGTCPSGLACSNGYCTAVGTQCGDGGIIGDSSLPASCGNGDVDPGEICFSAPIVIDTNAQPIFDGQIFDLDEDDTLDVMYLSDAALKRVPLNTSEVTPFADFDGYQFRVGNLDALPRPEVVHYSPVRERLDVFEFNVAFSTLTARGGVSLNKGTPTKALLVGPAPTNGTMAVAVFSDALYTVRLGNGEMPTVMGTAIPVTGANDAALVDYDNDLSVEIVVATNTGMRVFEWSPGMQNYVAVAEQPTTSGAINSVTSCNLDGTAGGELVFTRTGTGMMTQLGTLRWNATTGDWLEPLPRTVVGLLPGIDCTDLDKDGKSDVIAGASLNGNTALGILRGTATAELEDPLEVPVPNPFSTISARRDVNGDQIDDIVLTTTAMGKITLLESSR